MKMATGDSAVPTGMLQTWVANQLIPFCRCTYTQHGISRYVDHGPAATQDGAPVPPRRTRSQRTTTTGGALVKMTDPLWGMNGEGNAVQMHRQDVALITYEQLRKELSTSDR